jgi:hypothetical protein
VEHFFARGVDDRWQQSPVDAITRALYGIVVACGIDRKSGSKTPALQEII